jgi:RNA polymerase sigma-70 factor (ECF subfamily)
VPIGEQFPEILQAARLGAEWAWRALHRELAPAIVAYLRSHGSPEPEDLAGEVFLHLYRDLGRFDGGESQFRAFAFTIAHHRLVDDRRGRRRRPEEAAGGEVIEANAPDGDAEADAIDSLRSHEIRRLVAELSPDQRSVLLLGIMGGLNAEQVAAVLGKSAWAVRALQRRGLQSLRRRIAREAIQL